jgi:hypothetical protein
LAVAKVRERLAAWKRMVKINMETFNLKISNEREVKEKYQLQ